MDTLGLHIFDLPDLQCRYRPKASGGSHEPGQVAALLFNTAAYLFEHGDVIDDGHTISGTSEDEVFRCSHQDSLVEPHRLVLDVDLGAALREAQGAED
jgi:hypothetical protein